ncbi:hypothetical protein L484_023553 [Morus notabilis]|uniref:DYW domain-containing protein n=1 Tax=Morus notabilis TaxID=981085 RepID=W9R707_9ROSA|nr:pentatricopeptide repeat-containing protein At4g15720 [Morus notabilis]EXB74809.1 hypothetical protein L484_023553 [Morus notabilis]
MRRRGLVPNLNPNFLSRQNNLSFFHTNGHSHLIRNLQNCNNFIVASSLHSHILKSGSLSHTFTANHLLNCYVRLRKIDLARNLFDEMSEPNVVSWTAVIAGYIDLGQPRTALRMFGEMPECSVPPNEFTFSTAIKACSVLSNLRTGKEIHARVEVCGLRNNLVLCSTLVDMYGKCDDVDGARRVFDAMRCRNVVSWTTMIATYGQNARGHEALQLFREFSSLTRDRPNDFMLSSIVNACASLGKLAAGKAAHCAVIRGSHDANEVVATTLIDMYGKCGCLDYSYKIFRQVSCASVVPYTSMIFSAAKYGLGKLALELFDEMLERGIKPSDVTYLGVLHACSHSGLVDEGLKHLKFMYAKHGILPDTKHYTCLVDMLGRAGRIDEAYRVAKSIRAEGDAGALLWGTLLSASRLVGRVDIAVEAGRQLIESNQQVAGAYVTLSNTYALAGDWDSVRDLKREMKRGGVHKETACSWIDFKDWTYVFFAGDVLWCEQGSEVVNLLRELEKRMKERGYVGGGKGLVFVDVDEETEEEILGLHSERLALAFGLINLPKSATIRIMKNIRMCRDCHEAFKLISEILERDFIVRDNNRFHHFTNGYCICGDFW